MSSPSQPIKPLTLDMSGGTLSDVFQILQLSLNLLSVIPPTAAVGALGSLIMGIITASVNRIQSETGKPIDLSQIPFQQPLPPMTP